MSAATLTSLVNFSSFGRSLSKIPLQRILNLPSNMVGYNSLLALYRDALKGGPQVA